jgi:phosphate transport system protein
VAHEHVDGFDDAGADGGPGVRRDYRAGLASMRIELRTLGNEVLLLLADASAAMLQGEPSPERLRTLLREVTIDADRLEHDCFELLARQQPVGADLRGIVAALTIAQELHECARQIAELACHVAPAAVVARAPAVVRDLLGLMAAQASVELSLALEALSDSSSAIADALRDLDDVMNGLQRDLLRAVTEFAPSHGDDLQCLVQAALAARILERVGDRAVTCADRVLFWLTGEAPEGRTEDPVAPLS